MSPVTRLLPMGNNQTDKQEKLLLWTIAKAAFLGVKIVKVNSTFLTLRFCCLQRNAFPTQINQ